MHEYTIIRIAKVVLDLQLMLGKLIQLAQIDIKKKLATQIADRQAPPILGAKERFMGRDMAPEGAITLKDHRLRAIMKNHRPGQP